MAQNLPSSPQKRGGGIYRFASRRARAACMLCRLRKVRCDAEDGQRCSNCVFADVQCVAIASQRHRKSYTASKLDKSSKAKTADKETSSTNFTETTNQPERSNPQNHNSPAMNDGRSWVSQIHGHNSFWDQTSPANTSTQGPDNELDWQDAVAKQNCPPPVSPNAFIGSSTAGSDFPDVERHPPAVPDFVKPIPPHLAREDVEYLHRKGALTIPDPELRNDLLRSYIAFIHPCLPIIDLTTFQASLEDPSLHGPISFPLFQAIMFAGSPWVDIKQLRRLGYLTRMSARKSFYLKARMLYDIDYEEDPLCLVQILTLLSLWWESPNAQKNAWHWAGLSLMVARNMNLHHDISNQSFDPKLRTLRRKIWWSCVIRDTISSFASNRVPRITDEDFDIAMLTMNDFVIDATGFSATKWATPEDVKLQEQLAPVFIGMCKIARILSNILHLAYQENPAGYAGTLYSNQELNASPPAPAKTQTNIPRLAECEEDIRRWKEEVPENALHQCPTPSASLPHQQAPLLHRAILSIVYFTTILTLHKPHILPISTSMIEKSPEPGRQDSPRQTVRRAASLINVVLMDLYQADLMRFMPATGIGCLIPVCIVHVFDTKSSDQSIRREGSRRLEECKQALRELCDTHIAAEWAINFISFLASQLKPTHGPRRDLSGMIGGEIKWKLQTQPRPINTNPNALAISERNRASQNGIQASAPSHVETAHESQPLPTHPPEAWLMPNPRRLSNSVTSPDYFSDLINFPEMWLDFTAEQDKDNRYDIDLTNDYYPTVDVSL